MSLKEQEIEVPLDWIVKSPGFSLDIGASTGKLMYRSNKEFKNGKPIRETTKDKGTINIITFNQNDVDTAINVIKERCDVTWKEGDEPIKVTGVGCNLHKAKLEKGLDVKLENLDEFTCLVKAFMALKKSGDTDIFTKLSEEAVEEVEKVGAFMAAMVGFVSAGKMKEMKIRSRDEFHCKRATQIKLPCLMAVCGSVCAFIKIDENGKYRFLEGQLLGGKFFLGFSSILLGKKPFDELMNEVLAADGKTCDYLVNEALSKDRPEEEQQQQPETKETAATEATEEPRKRKESEQNVYSMMDKVKGGESMRFFPMAKVLDMPTDKVKAADACYSMLETICELITQSASLTAEFHGLKQVYFVGNFANIPQVRYWLTKLMYERVCLDMNEPLDFQFPKLGGQLGSLGAFII